jgi:hypothetical protein
VQEEEGRPCLSATTKTTITTALREGRGTHLMTTTAMTTTRGTGRTCLRRRYAVVVVDVTGEMESIPLASVEALL